MPGLTLLLSHVLQPRAGGPSPTPFSVSGSSFKPSSEVMFRGLPFRPDEQKLNDHGRNPGRIWLLPRLLDNPEMDFYQWP
jgi:hypothetical protein